MPRQSIKLRKNIFCSAGLAPLHNHHMFYPYVLKSLKDKKLYIGFTSDLKKRFFEHQKGKVIATRSRRPFQILFYEAFCDSLDAKRRERYLKTSKGRSSLKQMLRHHLDSA